MGFFSLEHSKAAYAADFAIYGCTVLVLLAVLVHITPPAQALSVVSSVFLGLISWSVLEYGLHRFVLHTFQPFKRWHLAHHQRPTALIGTPTVLSAALFATLVFLPLWLQYGLQTACSFTSGLLLGYLVYALTHHAIHHWHLQSIWFTQRRRWHAKHHQLGHLGCYGVTNSYWDHVFVTVQTNRKHRTTTEH